MAQQSAACAYFVLGWGFQGAPGAPGHIIALAGKQWDWLGASSAFLMRLNPGESLLALMGFESVALASLIPQGSGAERWRLSSVCAATAFFSAITFPLFAHWTWGGGWLARLGYVDTGGAGVIHVTGGLSALSSRGFWERDGANTAAMAPRWLSRGTAAYLFCSVAWSRV